RRQGGGARALRADRADLRAICRRGGPNDAFELRLLQFHRRDRMGRPVPGGGDPFWQRAGGEAEFLTGDDWHRDRLAAADGIRVSRAPATKIRCEQIRLKADPTYVVFSADSAGSALIVVRQCGRVCSATHFRYSSLPSSTVSTTNSGSSLEWSSRSRTRSAAT